MTIKQAIEKAIEEGWKSELNEPKISIPEGVYFNEGLYHFKLEELWFDPLFWQSLGKAMGWPEYNHLRKYYETNSWRGKWHHFIEHLAEGKSAESFFETL